MIPSIRLSFVLSAFLCGSLLGPAQLQAQKLDPVEIEETLEQAATWHLENPVQWLGLRWWHQAPFYDGLLALAEATGDPAYLARVIDYGERSGWALGDRPYHADDHAVGYAWLRIYQLDPEREERLIPTRRVLDHVVEHPIQETLAFGPVWDERVVQRWTWCDALYMSPPTLARLAGITGEEKYLRFMDYEFRVTYDALWDPEEQLFYRDARFPGQRTERDKKIFWSRGNGWVYGGLVQLLNELPQGDVARPFYEQLFHELTEGIVKAQQPDGLWRPSLRDPEQVTTGETSGTAFFLYGLAWGINEGLLERERYWPVLEKGWRGLLTRIHPSGRVGYVQPVGFDPRDNIAPESTQAYGAGAVFLAGAEILRALETHAGASLESLYEQATDLLAAGAFNRTVTAYVVPRRADDVAWENDRVAFRAYGPALRAATEDSGIDAWTKRVSTPVIAKWYAMEFAGTGSYHVDRGEGYDAFKVGAARGVGGTGIWYQDRFYTSNVYQRAAVKDTPPGVTAVTFDYTYEIEGSRIHEEKVVVLREGSPLCEAQSRFWGDEAILAEARVAIGLTPQSGQATVASDGPVMAVWDAIDGTWLATGVKLVDGFEPGSVELRENATETGDALLSARLSGERLRYQFGFAWERFSDFRSLEDWQQFLKQATLPEDPARYTRP